MVLAIMQGRLVPPIGDRIQCFPRDRWAEEFPLAAAAGLDAIEWIDDVYGDAINPIADDAGLARIKELSALHGVKVRSLCADYFMERPLIRASASEVTERSQRLAWLLERCASIGIVRVVLPFVDHSRIDPANELDEVAGILGAMVPFIENTGVELHLETSLSPADFAELLARVDHPMIKVNYDSGNSASLGYRPTDEFAAYGHRVGSVHIKDRVLGGSTVPLGTGDADFDALFRSLDAVGYAGDFVLQVARGMPGDETAWAMRNREFVLARVNGSGVPWTST